LSKEVHKGLMAKAYGRLTSKRVVATGKDVFITAREVTKYSGLKPLRA